MVTAVVYVKFAGKKLEPGIIAVVPEIFQPPHFNRRGLEFCPRAQFFLYEICLTGKTPGVKKQKVRPLLNMLEACEQAEAKRIKPGKPVYQDWIKIKSYSHLNVAL